MKKCKKNTQYNIPRLNNESKIITEYRFKYNGNNNIADLVYLKNDKIINIYEIYHTHKTKEIRRPEPWFEFNATNIINMSDKDEIAIDCLRNKYCDDCIYMRDLKKNDLKKWIRIKLGQSFKNPMYINYKNEIICKKQYLSLTQEEKKEEYYRIYHKRIDFSGGENCIDNNKKLCDIFKDDSNTHIIVLYASKGILHGYIISDNDYKKNNYWDEEYLCDGVNGVLDLPYLYKKNYTREGTIDVFYDLIKTSLKIIPYNGCNYEKK